MPDESSLGELLASIGVFGEADLNMVLDVVLGESSGKLIRIFKGNLTGMDVVEFVVETRVGKHVVETLVVETHGVETLERKLEGNL